MSVAAHQVTVPAAGAAKLALTLPPKKRYASLAFVATCDGVEKAEVLAKITCRERALSSDGHSLADLEHDADGDPSTPPVAVRWVYPFEGVVSFGLQNRGSKPANVRIEATE